MSFKEMMTKELLACIENNNEKWQGRQSNEVPCLIDLKKNTHSIIRAVYHHTGGNKAVTSALLGLTPDQLRFLKRRQKNRNREDYAG